MPRKRISPFKNILVKGYLLHTHTTIAIINEDLTEFKQKLV